MKIPESMKGYLLGSLLTFSALTYSQKQVNIVFIIADDVSWDDLGCYGNRW